MSKFVIGGDRSTSTKLLPLLCAKAIEQMIEDMNWLHEERLRALQ